MSTDWFILRTAGTSTLQLAKSLTDAGYEAWSPVEIQNRRRPRSKDRYERKVAVMPSWVFVRERHLLDILALAAKPMQTFLRWDAELRRMVAQGIPAFSVFLHSGRIPMIDDTSLNTLRVVERRTAPKPEARAFAPGEAVSVPEGGFAGLTGIVQSARGDYAMVAFPGFPMAIKISRLLLRPDMVDSASPAHGIAAQAA